MVEVKVPADRNRSRVGLAEELAVDTGGNLGG